MLTWVGGNLESRRPIKPQSWDWLELEGKILPGTCNLQKGLQVLPEELPLQDPCVLFATLIYFTLKGCILSFCYPTVSAAEHTICQSELQAPHAVDFLVPDRAQMSVPLVHSKRLADYEHASTAHRELAGAAQLNISST